MDNQNKVPNQLVNETSPYLLQHAYNPVKWYPWGEKAFEKAKAENKPIFLSIGYSTCHWCHVMEQESFEDEEVAALLNQYFIAVKVDKEERADVDAIYMNACQAMTGSGGWPLTILMSWNQKPFFAGTYFSKKEKYGNPGLLYILGDIGRRWKENQQELLKAGDTIMGMLEQQYKEENKEGELSKDLLENAMYIFEKSYDPKYGGFHRAPKFPSPHQFLFLLRQSYYEKDNKALAMVEHTLTQMYRGGIFDHIGYGFSRYSTDEKWLVPHFEKMLYDNALLAMAYTECYQITGNKLYAQVAQQTLEYITREMMDAQGGFYSAQDADSDGVEGKYYIFTPEEVIQVLGEEEGSYFNQYYDITKTGNFEGSNIPNLIKNQDYRGKLEELRPLLNKLYHYRAQRNHLHKDDKILTSWNGMMIGAFAKAFKIHGDISYLRIAQNAAGFLEKNLMDEHHNLFVSYREGKRKGMGLLDDYAYYLWALIELYEATFEKVYLKKARVIEEKIITQFWDEEHGGFYLYGKDHETLICRPKECYDGAMPSGNAVVAYCLVKLSKILEDPEIEEIAYKQLKYMAGVCEKYPSGHTFYLMALQMALYPAIELSCEVMEKKEIESIKKMVRLKFSPNASVVIKKIKGLEKSTYYICRNKTCSLPIHDLEELKKRWDL